MRKTPLVIVALSAMQVACSAEPTADTSTVRDSAGVEIVESSAPAWSDETAPRIAAEPRVRIGALDGPEELQLFEVRFATRLSDGRIAVGNGGTSQLRFFAADGEFDRQVGGEGEGPGEFSFMTRTYSRLPGDTLRLFDGSTRRITEFAADGTLVRSTALTPPDDGDLGAIFAGTFPDGRLVATTVELPPTGEMADGDLVRGERTYWTLDRTGATEITRLLEPERLVWVVDGSVRIRTLPLRFSEQVAVHEHLVVVSSDEHRLRWYTPDGRLARVARWNGEIREMTNARYEEWLQALPYEPGQVESMREQNEGLPLPPRVPTYESILVDADGNAWLERFRLTPAEPTLWTVIGPDGLWLGDVEVPEGLWIQEIGRDYVLGVWHDELEVPYVQLYDLER